MRRHPPRGSHRGRGAVRQAASDSQHLTVVLHLLVLQHRLLHQLLLLVLCLVQLEGLLRLVLIDDSCHLLQRLQLLLACSSRRWLLPGCCCRQLLKM